MGDFFQHIHTRKLPPQWCFFFSSMYTRKIAVLLTVFLACTFPKLHYSLILPFIKFVTAMYLTSIDIYGCKAGISTSLHELSKATVPPLPSITQGCFLSNAGGCTCLSIRGCTFICSIKSICLYLKCKHHCMLFKFIYSIRSIVKLQVYYSI